MVSQADMDMVAYTTGANTPQRMSVKAIARFLSSQASLELLPGKLSSAAYGTPPRNPQHPQSTAY